MSRWQLAGSSPISRSMHSWGGARAAAGMGGAVGNPRWPRICSMTSGCSMCEMRRILWPQRPQVRTSRSNTRLSNSAHLRRYGGGTGLGLAISGSAGAVASWSADALVTLGALVAPDTDSAAVDRRGNRALIAERALAFGAKMPSNRTMLIRGGGIVAARRRKKSTGSKTSSV